jgi:hypothetical protein
MPQTQDVAVKVDLFNNAIRKDQMAMAGCEGLSFAKQFFALAGQVRPA